LGEPATYADINIDRWEVEKAVLAKDIIPV